LIAETELKMVDLTVRDTGRPDLGGNIRNGDNATFSPGLWHYFVERFAIRSMLDVASGIVSPPFEGYRRSQPVGSLRSLMRCPIKRVIIT
jgi:hypothetical protein